uniref:SET domain-containing protein n=1 Tax=Aureoumbra lagunensis TaxID=44058 RepID=A0A7S3JNV4_9STRA
MLRVRAKKRKKKQVVPRRYRPPGAAARKIMCGGDELAMEVLAPEICISLAGGLGADMSEKIQVVRLECGPMRGERGVVARAEIEARSVLPYAGLIVADDELASLLWQEPRAVAHCLMYRYEFAGPQISVLPYLQSPSCAPAPFVNCARGPHSTEAIVWQTSRTLDKSNEEISLKLSWRSWGSEHIGARIRRTVDGGGFADGTVVAWLDANESDFVVNDIPAALWRVKYDDNSVLAGDFQDLELHEILSSAKAPLPVETTTLDLPSIPNRACSEESVVSTNANKQANCHFEEVTADGAVLGVYVVASRKIMRGEPLLVTYGCEFWSGWIQRRSRLEELERAADTLCNSCYELIKAIDSERDGQADDDQRITTTNDHHPLSSSSSISCCDENNNMMIDENTTNEQASKRHQVPTRIDRHEVWRYLIGIPFQAQRTIRGERGCLAVVVGLAVEPPAECSLTEFQINDRVEGYWRGSAPSFAATVAGFDQEGNAYLDYDDGFKEVTDLVLPLRSQREWIQMETVQVGTWVRHFEHITANGRSRREGIVVSKMFAQDGGLLLNVMTDDGFLETEQPARDWEPLLVVRFATNNEQRVMNIDQLLFMQPLFINAQTEEPLFADASSANKQLFSFLDHGEHVHQHLVQYFFHSNDPREDHKENTQQNNDEKIPPCLKVDIARVLTEVGLPRMPKLARGCA